jgi:microcystin degradation protein MlrC
MQRSSVHHDTSTYIKICTDSDEFSYHVVPVMDQTSVLVNLNLDEDKRKKQ